MFPRENQSFDPTRISDAIKRAGFSAPKVEIVALGKIEKWKDMLALRVPGQPQVFVLEGGKQFDAFRKSAAVGKPVRIAGLIHGSHGDSSPGLTVEKFE
ncbi:MAG: hypothetical protein HY238_22415 [Acidobacteria bacterium]|nr:hypothetical protein [Acidobacteriota bacterium]